MSDEMKSAPVGVDALAALRIAHKHLDMRSMRVSHCKDAAAIESALAQQPAADERGAYYVCPVCHGPGRVTRETHDRYQQPAAVALSREELDTCRQWFDSVQDTNGGYLTPDDYVLAEKLYRSVGMRVPDSLGRVATQQGGRR